MPVVLPDSFVGGPIADSDPKETVEERFEGTQRNFDFIKRLMIDTGGVSVGLRFGTESLNFPGAAISDVLTVTHGLGNVPLAVVATAHSPSGGATGVVAVGVVNGSIGTTTFQLQGEDVSGTALGPGTVPVWWVALG